MKKATITLTIAVILLLSILLDEMLYRKVKEAIDVRNYVLGTAKIIPETNILVKEVTDGDTIVLENNSRVRLIGIDAPELEHEGLNIKQECYANESKDYLKQLLQGKTVKLEKDRTDLDRYDRKLRYIFINDNLVNEDLVKNGYAKSYAYPPDIKYQVAIDTAQEYAKANKVGLWGACRK